MSAKGSAKGTRTSAVTIEFSISPRLSSRRGRTTRSLTRLELPPRARSAAAASLSARFLSFFLSLLFFSTPSAETFFSFLSFFSLRSDLSLCSDLSLRSDLSFDFLRSPVWAAARALVSEAIGSAREKLREKVGGGVKVGG